MAMLTVRNLPDEVHRALTQAVADGTITTERLNESVKRILLMKMQTQIEP